MTRVRLRSILFLVFFLAPVLTWFPAPALAQRTNTFYVSEFAGADVATKTTNAQNACISGIKCVIVFDVDLANYPAGNMPSACGQCTWVDWRSSNPFVLGINSVGTLITESTNNMAFRNGPTSQAVSLYNTYTDGSNYERMRFFYSGGDGSFHINAENAGTGSSRSLIFNANGAGGAIKFYTGGYNARWAFDNNGHLMALTDNAFDIGAAGASRPRNVYIAGNLNIGGTCTGCGTGSTLSATTTTIGGSSVNPYNATSGTVTLTGVVAGTPCIATASGGQLPGNMAGFYLHAVGTASNQVTVTLINLTSGAQTPAALAYNVRCWL